MRILAALRYFTLCFTSAAGTDTARYAYTATVLGANVVRLCRRVSE